MLCLESWGYSGSGLNFVGKQWHPCNLWWRAPASIMVGEVGDDRHTVSVHRNAGEQHPPCPELDFSGTPKPATVWLSNSLWMAAVMGTALGVETAVSGVSRNICIRTSPRTLASAAAVTLPYGRRSSHCGYRERSHRGLRSAASCQQACARPSGSLPPHTAKEKHSLVTATDASIRKTTVMAHSGENYHREGWEAGLGSSGPAWLVALMGWMWLGTGMKVGRKERKR